MPTLLFLVESIIKQIALTLPFTDHCLCTVLKRAFKMLKMVKPLIVLAELVVFMASLLLFLLSSLSKIKKFNVMRILEPLQSFLDFQHITLIYS